LLTGRAERGDGATAGTGAITWLQLSRMVICTFNPTRFQFSTSTCALLT
jgi:hypothetical protein